MFHGHKRINSRKQVTVLECPIILLSDWFVKEPIDGGGAFIALTVLTIIEAERQINLTNLSWPPLIRFNKSCDIRMPNVCHEIAAVTWMIYCLIVLPYHLRWEAEFTSRCSLNLSSRDMTDSGTRGLFAVTLLSRPILITELSSPVCVSSKCHDKYWPTYLLSLGDYQNSWILLDQLLEFGITTIDAQYKWVHRGEWFMKNLSGLPGIP